MNGYDTIEEQAINILTEILYTCFEYLFRFKENWLRD